MVPRKVDKAAKRAEIIAGATEVFSRKGFQGASVDDIAEAAGVSKGTVYLYFDNKEDVFFATFQSFEGEVAAQFEASMACESSAAGKLALSLREVAVTLRENIDVFPLTLEVWAAASSGKTRDRFAVAMEGLYHEFRGMAAALIEAGKAAGEFREDVNAEAVAAWVVGGLDGLILQSWFDPSIDVSRLTEDFLQVLLQGISVQHPDGGEA